MDGAHAAQPLVALLFFNGKLANLLWGFLAEVGTNPELQVADADEVALLVEQQRGVQVDAACGARVVDESQPGGGVQVGEVEGGGIVNGEDLTAVGQGADGRPREGRQEVGDRRVGVSEEAIGALERGAVTAGLGQRGAGLAAQIHGDRAEAFAQQWVAHSGLDPAHQVSGSSVKKPSRISRAGNRNLRRVLYMPALVAIQHDPHIKAFYHSLVERHKAKMQALIAVARKRLHAIYGIFKSNTTYDGRKLFPNLIPS